MLTKEELKIDFTAENPWQIVSLVTPSASSDIVEEMKTYYALGLIGDANYNNVWVHYYVDEKKSADFHDINESMSADPVPTEDKIYLLPEVKMIYIISDRPDVYRWLSARWSASMYANKTHTPDEPPIAGSIVQTLVKIDGAYQFVLGKVLSRTEDNKTVGLSINFKRVNVSVFSCMNKGRSMKTVQLKKTIKHLNAFFNADATNDQCWGEVVLKGNRVADNKGLGRVRDLLAGEEASHINDIMIHGGRAKVTWTKTSLELSVICGFTKVDKVYTHEV